MTFVISTMFHEYYMILVICTAFICQFIHFYTYHCCSFSLEFLCKKYIVFSDTNIEEVATVNSLIPKLYLILVYIFLIVHYLFNLTQPLLLMYYHVLHNNNNELK